MQSRRRETGIGERVRAARERREWTREMLAVSSEISWSAIAQIESGRRQNLRPATLAALAGALGVSIDHLVNGRGTRTSSLMHSVLVYDDEDAFAQVAVPFMAEGGERGEALIAVTAPANAERLRDGLGADASLVDFRDPTEIYTSPRATLAAYEEIVAAAVAAGAPWIRAIGEPIWAGRSEAEVRRWTRYESVFNLVFADAPLSAICPYDTRVVPDDVVVEARATHPLTVGADGPSESAEFVEPGAFITAD